MNKRVDIVCLTILGLSLTVVISVYKQSQVNAGSGRVKIITGSQQPIALTTNAMVGAFGITPDFNDLGITDNNCLNWNAIHSFIEAIIESTPDYTSQQCLISVRQDRVNCFPQNYNRWSVTMFKEEESRSELLNRQVTTIYSFGNCLHKSRISGEFSYITRAGPELI